MEATTVHGVQEPNALTNDNSPSTPVKAQPQGNTAQVDSTPRHSEAKAKSVLALPTPDRIARMKELIQAADDAHKPTESYILLSKIREKLFEIILGKELEMTIVAEMGMLFRQSLKIISETTNTKSSSFFGGTKFAIPSTIREELNLAIQNAEKEIKRINKSITPESQKLNIIEYNDTSKKVRAFTDQIEKEKNQLAIENKKLKEENERLKVLLNATQEEGVEKPEAVKQLEEALLKKDTRIDQLEEQIRKLKQSIEMLQKINNPPSTTPSFPGGSISGRSYKTYA